MTCSPSWLNDGSDIPDPTGAGQKAVDFLRLMRHPKSAAEDRQFELSPFMERIVRRIYGPVDDNGRRQVKTVFLMLPRGNRKTTLGAGLALLHTVGPQSLRGGQVITAAADRKQARIAYEEAVGILDMVPSATRHIQFMDYRNRLKVRRTATVFEAISSDAGTQHGRTPTFLLADELHAWPKRDLWDVLRTGLTKTPGSLLLITTTAGRGQDNLAWDLYDYAKMVAAGEVEDPSWLPILFEAPRDCDWRDEELWHEVNPGLQHGFPDIDGLRQLAREAETRPADREAFKQLHLNVWLDHSTDPFVDMGVYDLGGAPIDLETLSGAPCWLGVDLSSNQDLTAIVAAWRADEGYIVRPWFFCPAENLMKRADRDGVPYPRWAEEGLITPTPGDVVDYAFVEDRIRQLCEDYPVQEIAFDPHLAQQTMTRLGEDGYPVASFRQGWATMGPAIKELERAILGKRFQHGGHPVLRWHFSNIAIKRDEAGNISFHKGKSTDRIDGAVAAAMAVARAAAGEAGISVYETVERSEGVLFV